MNGGIGPVNPLLGMSSIITEPLALQKTPGQLHGDEEAFQFVSDGGFPHRCLRLSNVLRSEVKNCCELTPENSTTVMKTNKKSVCKGIGIDAGGGSLAISPVILWRWWLPGKINGGYVFFVF